MNLLENKNINYFEKSTKYTRGEELVKEILEELKIEFIREKKFPDLKHKGLLRFDFYIERNLKKSAIEYDRIQHFIP